ncbi:MAG: helix-turn-helix transcriptional regulator [Clostridia bacterium]|nr:helix-turn-helix transcriptional regulator [Clostridia bacterium]
MKRESQPISYDCPMEATLGLIGGKWKTLILDHLTGGALRFGALQKCMPKITPKMLTQQLRELEEDGLVSRHVFPVVPPRVEYELTEFGQTVLPVLEAMGDWGRMYLKLQPAELQHTTMRQTVVQQTKLQ